MIYYCILKIRHWLYDKGILKSRSFDIPTVCVGNVTVGGTGKTPFTELLIRLFSQDMRVAVISRGYKRKSKGFHEVCVGDDYTLCGDEPLQMKKKFPNVRVVVDASRTEAMERLSALEEGERPQIVILDDAFQHRKVRPDCSIVLMKSSRPVFKDFLLPWGRLRDLSSRIHKADILVVTKNVNMVDDSVREYWRSNLKIEESMPLLFSRVSYGKVEPVFPDKCDLRYSYSKNVVLFSGIADDSTLRRELSWDYTLSDVISFPDHHPFKLSDLKRVNTCAKEHPTAMIITTEKDAQRIVSVDGIPDSMKMRLFYIPIVTRIIPPEQRRDECEDIRSRESEQSLKEMIVNIINKK